MTMKKFLFSLVCLLATASAAFAQEHGDYYVKHGADVNVNHKDILLLQ